MHYVKLMWKRYKLEQARNRLQYAQDQLINWYEMRNQLLVEEASLAIEVAIMEMDKI